MGAGVEVAVGEPGKPCAGGGGGCSVLAKKDAGRAGQEWFKKKDEKAQMRHSGEDETWLKTANEMEKRDCSITDAAVKPMDVYVRGEDG